MGCRRNMCKIKEIKKSWLNINNWGKSEENKWVKKGKIVKSYITKRYTTQWIYQIQIGRGCIQHPMRFAECIVGDVLQVQEVYFLNLDKRFLFGF